MICSGGVEGHAHEMLASCTGTVRRGTKIASSRYQVRSAAIKSEMA
jgi:hypothetical protein